MALPRANLPKRQCKRSEALRGDQRGFLGYSLPPNWRPRQRLQNPLSWEEKGMGPAALFILQLREFNTSSDRKQLVAHGHVVPLGLAPRWTGDDSFSDRRTSSLLVSH